MTEKEWGRCKYLSAPFGFFSCTKYGMLLDFGGDGGMGYPRCKKRRCSEIEYDEGYEKEDL